MIVRVVIGLVLLAAVVGAGIAVSSSGPEPLRYKVALDNTYGLTEGVDLRVAGVQVGQVKSMDVRRSDFRALVDLEITDTSFGRFRKDVFCKVQPQSLIGEYFLNCDPGKDKQALPVGATIPVEQTAGTVPADLVQNVMRKPYRERLGIILTELGAGFAARGEDVNATITRAMPALRETDEVLQLLERRKDQLTSLQRNGARVLTRLAREREGVADFVTEAGDTAAASAERRDDLAGTFQRFPRFLQELR